MNQRIIQCAKENLQQTYQANDTLTLEIIESSRCARPRPFYEEEFHFGFLLLNHENKNK